jgi:uncharacterized protein
MENISELAERLENWFTGIEKAAIALSGGIDSSLVAFTARKKLGRENVIAVISASASVKQRDLKDARSFTGVFDIPLQEIDAREIDDPDYAKNPVNRCFFCKTALYDEMDRLIAENFPGYTVLNGNNYSDFGDYRPGLEAGSQHKVLSPLAACKFTKDDIRTVARHYGLPNWSKPASPCLSSRFPYGENITREKLKMVELAEDVLNDFGFDHVRVRYFSRTAKIEVPADRIQDLRKNFKKIRPRITSFGFDECTIDAEGLVSGKLNRAIPGAK